MYAEMLLDLTHTHTHTHTNTFAHTHSLFALWQMYVVMFPDVGQYFMSHGSPDLQVIYVEVYADLWSAAHTGTYADEC